METGWVYEPPGPVCAYTLRNSLLEEQPSLWPELRAQQETERRAAVSFWRAADPQNKKFELSPESYQEPLRHLNGIGLKNMMDCSKITFTTVLEMGWCRGE